MTARNDLEQRLKYTKSYSKFAAREDAQAIIDCFGLYFARCTQLPKDSFSDRWMISVLRTGCLASLTIGPQWACVCRRDDDNRPIFAFYGRGATLRSKYGTDYEGLPDFCEFEEAGEKSGGPDQLRLYCALEDVPSLLDHEVVRNSLRIVADQLMLRATSFRSFQCVQLADAVIASAKRTRLGT